MIPSPSTLKALFAVCGNVCAFPGCIAPVYDTRYSILVGEVCHIEANSEKGPRYNKNQTEDARQAIDNLICMCSPHHTVIDDKSRVDEFTVEVLKKMKRDHEEHSHNTIPTEDVLERLVRKILELHAPPPPAVSLVPIVESIIGSQPDTIAGIDYYNLRIRLHNDSSSAARDYQIEVEIPDANADPSERYFSQVHHHTRANVS